jgi:hypothetical protein
VSYELRIWDPARHGPLPTSAADAGEMMERLSPISEERSAALERFGASLLKCYEAESAAVREHTGLDVFWGTDPCQSTAACRTAVFRLSLPSDAQKQICLAVEAALAQGLVVYDDELGVCFLPDGAIFPEDSREGWESDLAEVKAGPEDPSKPKKDSRTLLQKIAGELFDAIGQGNNHQH